MGLLETLYKGILNQEEPKGILNQPQPIGLLGALYANPMLQRQIAAQRQTPKAAEWFPNAPKSWPEWATLAEENLLKTFPPASAPDEVRDQAAFNMAMNVGPLATVFHGSPHLFDKFDMSKVGTGEGAQAYGKGLYFAENPGVAKGYQAKLSGADSGALYKVDLPDEAIGKMLDWDKPLGQQPESVQRALRTYIGEQRFLLNKSTKAGEYFMGLEGRNSPEAVAQALRTNGIPGIKYLDQGSRAEGRGTSNFVVFDDQIPKILGRE